MIEDRKILMQEIIQIFITVRNQTEMVEALISEGANVNNQDQCLKIGILFSESNFRVLIRIAQE